MTVRKASTTTDWSLGHGVIGRWRVKNDDRTRTYTVVATKGVWQCSCMGWTRHMPRKDCKHITHIKRQLEG